MAAKARNRTWKRSDREAVTRYIGMLQEELRLRDWDITVDFDHMAAGDAYAEITPHENQKRAEIRFGLDFMTLDAAGVRQTLTHELLHCHLFNTLHVAENIFEASMGGKAAAIAGLAMNAEIERATDAIADAISASLPLPPQLSLTKAVPSTPVLVSLPSAVKSSRRKPRSQY